MLYRIGREIGIPTITLEIELTTKQTAHAELEGREQELQDHARQGLQDRVRHQREHEDRAWAEWWAAGGIFEALGCPELAVRPSERTEKQNLKVMLHNIKRNMKDEPR